MVSSSTVKVRAAADDDVQLLVDARSSARTLAMRRDDQLAAIGPVGTDAEGLYSEFGSEREPGCRIRVSRSHVIEVQDLHGGSTLPENGLTGERTFV
jgi:hypothetical protein